MKIGIVTLTDGDNFGNVLQNYALQQWLSCYGDVETLILPNDKPGVYRKAVPTIKKLTLSYVIKYVSNRLKDYYNIKNREKSILSSIKYYKRNENQIQSLEQKRQNSFAEFRTQYLNINRSTAERKVLEQVGKDYDAFIVGSDQVWNPVYRTTNSDMFLHFAPKHKRIAYAASFGVSTLPEESKPQYKDWLQGMNCLSVRESSGQKIIEQLTGKKASVMPDPTLLWPTTEWEKLMKRPESMQDNPDYMLVYCLGKITKEYNNFIKKKSNEENLAVIKLYDIYDLQHYADGPSEFLYLIKNAKFVCTDSFHCAVFSILFKKDFIVFDRQESGASMGSRLEQLLKTFELKEHFYHKNKDGKWDVEKNQTIEVKLDDLRLSAKKYIDDALEQVKYTISEEQKASIVKEQCCGCGACAQKCPSGCIEMQADEEGFLYPHIDEIKCIHCDQCKAVCPMLKLPENISKNNQEQDLFDCYVAYSNNKEIRQTSSSGGMFSELSKTIFNKQGIVFGAGFDSEYNVVHSLATSMEELENLKGSKYVQSEIGDTYKNVKSLLDKGQKVYFSGTPCQIAGLYAYLGKEYDNLITQDIICHGVPSPLVWKKYKDGFGKLEKASFRNKKYGWHYFSMQMKSEKKNQIKNLEEDFYLRLFLDNTILRPICYDCPMKKSGSCADITLADCWSLNKVTDKVKDTDEGLSLALLHTEKGKQLFEQLIANHCVTAVNVDTKKAVDSQSALRTSANCNPGRKAFFEALQNEDFGDIQKNWYPKDGIKATRKKINYYKMKLKQKIGR